MKTIRQDHHSVKKGDVLITRDDNTPVIDHGHEAIVFKNGER